MLTWESRKPAALVPTRSPEPFGNLWGLGWEKGRGPHGHRLCASIHHPSHGTGTRQGDAGRTLGPTRASVDLQSPHAEVAGGAGVDAHPELADAVPPDEQEEPVVARDAAVVLGAQHAARAVLQQAGTRCGDTRAWHGQGAREGPSPLPSPWG